MALSPVSLLSSLDYSISDESFFGDSSDESSLGSSTSRPFQNIVHLKQFSQSEKAMKTRHDTTSSGRAPASV